jgi:hypothetical protein
MIRRISLILACVAVVGAASGPAAAVPGGRENGRPSDAGSVLRSCGTPDPSPQELERVRAAARQWMEERGLQTAKTGGTISVAFHIITSSGAGQVTDAQVAAQIAELNRDYKGTGYSFRLTSVDRSDNNAWYHMAPGTGTEKKAKQALAVDPAHHLNIYTCAPGQHLAGWSYFPWSLPEDSFLHGVVVHYGTLPGGYVTRYNLGRTAVHEVGHYLGLLHTFENGCDAPGDEVEDTPFEASPAFGCLEGRDTCPTAGLDPIHNYMDYSDDPCITEFTGGQDARMSAIVPVYRPSLFDATIAFAASQPEIGSETEPPAERTSGIEFRGAGPNPFRFETAVRFTLPQSEHVALRAYNVAGQMVRTLIDAQLPAGSHSALFAGRELPAGLYFLSLKVGKTQMTRSVILLR